MLKTSGRQVTQAKVLPITELDKDTFTVSVILHGFKVDPHQITDKLGIQPTKIYKEGEQIQSRVDEDGRPICYDENVWILDFSGNDEELEEDIISRAIETLKPIKQNFIEVSQSCEAELSVYGTKYHYHTGVHLDKHALHALNELNLEFDYSIHSFTAEYFDKQANVNSLVSKLSSLDNTGRLSPDTVKAVVDYLTLIEAEMPSLLERGSDLIDDSDPQIVQMDMREFVERLKKLPI